MTTLRDIGEDALIERLVGLMPLDVDPAAGPGDDCAVVDPGDGGDRLQLLKTDALVGQVHFLAETPACAVGWKAVARVVSDFAAMGGKAERFLITVALAPDTKVGWVEDLYRGMGACMESFGAVLAGGETSSVPAGAAPVISVAATGSVRRGEVVLRSTGRVGDVILVTGRLGGSLAGKHLDFTPRVAESRWLVRHYKPTAMMDLSDGLAKDLPRLAAGSGCGFVIDRQELPLSPACSIREALEDGEDFELLMAVDPAQVPAMLAEWPRVFPGLALTEIGRLVEAAEGECLRGGWDHFAPPEGEGRV